MAISARQVVHDLNRMLSDSLERKHTLASKWAWEMLAYVKFDVQADYVETVSEALMETACSAPTYQPSKNDLLVRNGAKILIECQEFERASKYSAGYKDPVLLFIHYYSLYLAGEKKKLDDMADVLDKQLQFDNPFLISLQNQLENMHTTDAANMDGFLLHLYAFILKEQNLLDEAKKVFVRSIKVAPHFWFSWLELAKLIKNKEQLQSLDIPDHWMQKLFLGEVYLRLQMLQEALQIYDEFSRIGIFKNSLYIKTQMAVVYHNLQNPDSVVELFKEIQEIDETRLDHLDKYSNCLFVKRMTAELTSLTHHCFDVNKYCPETCCVVGDYFSARGEHEQAIVYLQRAIKLNPNNSGVYTLMGHEFMELKNTSAACIAYRKALQINAKDFRAWYGLGQVYDILKMTNYATYYYNMAHKVRPQDSRIIIALGDMFEKQQKFDDAKRCFSKAHCVGDMEGLALLKLGKLHEKMNDQEQAASNYTTYLRQLKDQGIGDPEHQPGCLRFLAEYQISKDLDQAYEYAQMCLEFESTKEEAKGILKRISQIRAASSGNEADSIVSMI